MSRKKSAELHSITGSLRKDRHDGGDIQFDSVPPVKPVWLSGAASELWDQTVSLIHGYGYLSSIDGMALSLYCELSVEFSINPSEFPAGKMAQLRGLISSFGMTPESRSKMPVPKKNEKKNGFADL